MAPDPPRLIVLNGPPACGKSTLSRRYAEEHPLTLNLDLDRLRALIGSWRSAPGESGTLVRAAALAAARAHLAAGHDVVIPQFVAHPEFLERIERLAREVGARFHEVVLMDSKANVLRRFVERTRTSADRSHQEAHELLEAGGGLPELAAMHDRLRVVVASRPAARVVPAVEGRVEETYRAFLAALS